MEGIQLYHNEVLVLEDRLFIAEFSVNSKFNSLANFNLASSILQKI